MAPGAGSPGSLSDTGTACMLGNHSLPVPLMVSTPLTQSALASHSLTWCAAT